MKVTILVDENKSKVIVNDKVYENISIEVKVDEVFESYVKGKGLYYTKTYTPGRVTYVIWHDGYVVFQTHNKPTFSHIAQDFLMYYWESEKQVSESITFIDGDKVIISMELYKKFLKAQEVQVYVDGYGLESLSAVQAAFSDEDNIFGQSLLDAFKAIDAL